MLFKQKNEPAPLTPDVFVRLREFIRERSGLFFPEGRQNLLADQLLIRLKASRLESYDDYLALLLSPAGKKELPRLYDAVTTWDTRFFRDPAQLDAFQNVVVPEALAARGPSRALRVLSAGCSTGEEPYTIAILLREHAGRTGVAFPVDILGWDISAAAVEFAQRAVYSNHALRATPPAIREKYFTRLEQGQHALRDDVRSMVTITRVNLANRTALSTLADLDVIFCRNVVTYMDDGAKQCLLGQFRNGLRHGGTLFLGRAESLHDVATDLGLVQFDGALGYRKE